jgi:hypothetical protein
MAIQSPRRGAQRRSERGEALFHAAARREALKAGRGGTQSQGNQFGTRELRGRFPPRAYRGRTSHVWFAPPLHCH